MKRRSGIETISLIAIVLTGLVACGGDADITAQEHGSNTESAAVD